MNEYHVLTDRGHAAVAAGDWNHALQFAVNDGHKVLGDPVRGDTSFDVVCATKGERSPQGLGHISCHYRYLENRSPNWAVAANALLDQAEFDVLFIDDDITITPSTFDLLDKYWDQADIFGFTLVKPDRGDILSCGCEYRFATDGKQVVKQLKPLSGAWVLTPCLVPHVTASCMVVKRRTLDAGLRFPVWPGTHFEDIAFTLDAWLRGFKVAYLPGVVLHDMATHLPVLVGATKAKEPDFMERRAINHECLQQWLQDNGVEKALEERRIPFDPIPLLRN